MTKKNVICDFKKENNYEKWIDFNTKVKFKQWEDLKTNKYAWKYGTINHLMMIKLILALS